MKILTLCHPTQGGSGVIASELAMAMAQQGHDLHLLSRERPFRLREDSFVRFHQTPRVDYPLFAQSPEDLCLANSIADIVDRQGIEIIHAHYAIPHAIAAIFARQMLGSSKPKILTTLHGTDIMLVGVRPELRRICGWALQQSDMTTAVSTWLANLTQVDFPENPRPRVIHNFVDPARFHSNGRAPLPTDGRFRLLHVSNFRTIKRCGDVIRIFAAIRAAHPDSVLTLLGDGPELAPTLALAREMGISGSVEWKGVIKSVSTQYRESHLFLLPSEYESCSLAAIEALATGTPVVATAAGGIPEVVTADVGHLAEVGDIDAMVSAALHLLGNPGAWQACSELGQARVKGHFSLERALALYQDSYERVLRPGAVPHTEREEA